MVEENWQLEEAETVPFWMFTEDKASTVYTPESLLKALQGLAKKAEREAEKEGVNAEDAAKLKAMGAQVEAFAGTLNA
jgi:hypothetical protein